MERIGDEVGRELRRFGPAAGMARIVAAWPAAVGEAIARNAWPARIGRDGTLHVSVSSSAWGFELSQLEAEIRGRLRPALGELAPTALRFAPGPVPETRAETVSKESRSAPAPSSATRAAAASIASGIGDPELRELVARAAAASLAERSSGRPL